MPLLDPALSREEVKNVVEGKAAAQRIPMAIHQWINAKTFSSRESQYQELLDQYPCDIRTIYLNIPKVFDAPEDDPSYRWLNFNNPFPQGTALDAVSALDDWAKLDDVLADFPNPYYPGLIVKNLLLDDGIYRVGHWWY